MRSVSEHRYHCGKRGEDFSPFRCAQFRAVEVVLGEVPVGSAHCSLVGVSVSQVEPAVRANFAETVSNEEWSMWMKYMMFE